MRLRVRRLDRPGLVTLLALLGVLWRAAALAAQGVTTGSLNGFVLDENGKPLVGAVVRAVHEPSRTQYTGLVRAGGAFTIPNMRVGGPYTVTAELIGRRTEAERDVYVQLAQTVRLDFALAPEAIELKAVEVAAERGEVFNSARTGATTLISRAQVEELPSIKRSTRDLIRLDPRNDGNYSFAGRNWLFNNISLDGSYFNNPYGLDDPAPGGQTSAEPVPYDAVEQVQVSVAPFDVREGGFTGANVNTVTKSGTNALRVSAYTFVRNESLIGNKVRGVPVIANPDLRYNQSGFTLSGPLLRDKLFFFLNGELERRDDPGSDFVANKDGTVQFGESRVQASVMDRIRERMIQVYNYDPGPYEGYINKTDNNKALLRLDWNVNAHNNLSFRYNLLDAKRDLPPHPFVLSFNNTGRGPNSSSLPFRNSGYTINNRLNSFALELNSRGDGFANRFFASYNRFRDFRDPFSADFPTIEIGEAGVTYTTVGHEPFSIHNILDQDVVQLTNNFTLFRGKHSLTLGANFETFGFFNSFNIFRDGVFFLPYSTGIGSTFASLDEFFQATDPAHPIDFRKLIGSGPYKGENVDVGQLSFYAQDELLATQNLTLTYGVRMDLPMYFTKPVANPFSRSLKALDENRQPETVDEAALPGASPLFSPRLGFNWDVAGRHETQLRGGTGVFTGRVPFVWVGNVISNPGANPNLFPTGKAIPTKDGAVLAQSFDVNAMDPKFKWPQVWVTDLAVDRRLPGDVVGTVELIYGNDIHNVFMRNADLVKPLRTLQDGRPYYGGFGNNELNPDGGAGIYVIDNTSDGYNVSASAQLRKQWAFGLGGAVSYAYTEAKNKLKSTEIASVLWQNQPVQGDPNNPELSFSEFGQRHRIVGSATYTANWSPRLATHFGLYFETAEGNRFAGAGGNRYSFIYAGDVNGDGQGGNDLIFIPRDQSQIRLAPRTAGGRTISAAEQWSAFDAFIGQDPYLRKHRGRIAERFGGVNPWYSDIDLRVMQDVAVVTGGRRQALQLNVDVLNVANLLNSRWGVRKVADPAATSPLSLVRFDPDGEPVFNFIGPSRTFIDDPSIFSRWQVQVGLKYMLN
ncbi:MAG TPA: carboxypeptidase regulatory-like domain-containing protein [Longimicrobiales bacterium]|nr:carboxypeptidase regulatory-like domain-containing protein [Longimicrobiales bacterium]